MIEMKGSNNLTTCIQTMPAVKVFFEEQELGEIRSCNEPPFLSKGQRTKRSYEAVTLEQRLIGKFQPHFMELAKGYELVLPTYGTILDTTRFEQSYHTSVRGVVYELRNVAQRYEYVVDGAVKMILAVDECVTIIKRTDVAYHEQLLVAMLALELAA